MATTETVECDDCGLRVRLHRDGTYYNHGWLRRGMRIRCDRSGTPYSRHMASVLMVTRDPDLWLCKCRCGESWTGARYPAVEEPWQAHVESMGAS